MISDLNGSLWSKYHFGHKYCLQLNKRGEIEQQAFSSVKSSLPSTPILALFYASHQTKLSTDGSYSGVGVVLQGLEYLVLVTNSPE